ncbi:hypothetical protein IMG5_099950 [Ichthyophthirius multifiliis]|uniref:Acyl-CoA oxidase n=1 Tax=Ichthyophthirius multifiliis TaxID=5932 RepID=G0QS93_ICHMU|nr:hypothetical protein IMG5_099950 [Ichthyophthirius multifiliis]EGR31915.1 hypothetical protein IMG5_099950 [Ichthyophthirius multifiliis]|eukprot:XP_004035401.1 hypothetical protein IMG5_099950 [Ichthyophthirius multifiliis]
MSDRLNNYKNQITQFPIVESSIDYFDFPSLLTSEQNTTRKAFREFLHKEIAPYINEYIEKAQFPDFVLPKFRQFGLFNHLLNAPYGLSSSILSQGILFAEISRVDASLATFSAVQSSLLMSTIEILGSEEQKNKYLPKLRDLELVGGWGLTEEKVGSDASSLQTSVKRDPSGKGWILNGNKRWIGNGNKDIMIVWARNVENNKVQGFIVDLKSPGVNSVVIKNKLALRMVQNCQIQFNNVHIPEENFLPKATDFQKGTSKILLHSRLIVCWITFGVAMGVYDHTIKYMNERKQFGVKISSFQIQQEKIQRIMSNVQAILFLCWRLSVLYDQGNITIGQVALGKAFATERTREITRLGREIFGGNGIIFDNYVMKALVDTEALYTYEGTYDINALVAGRELTGISAFKTK